MKKKEEETWRSPFQLSGPNEKYRGRYIGGPELRANVANSSNNSGEGRRGFVIP